MIQMWKGCELTLMQYTLTLCSEWRTRGCPDNVANRVTELCQDALYQKVWSPHANAGRPWWLGNPGFHLSHQSVLLRKAPEHYRKFWPKVSPDLPEVWPEWREPVRT